MNGDEGDQESDFPGIGLVGLVGQFDARSTAVVAAAGGGLLIRPNPNRFCLAFSTQTVGNIAFNFRSLAGATDGFMLASVSDRLFFNFRDHGVWPTLGWYYNSAAGLTVMVWESIWTPER